VDQRKRKSNLARIARPQGIRAAVSRGGATMSRRTRDEKCGLAADNEKIARSNSRAGEVILGLEGLERDAKPF
jgi:hypothetical protein